MDFPPVCGTLNENQLLRAQQNQEGDSDIYRLLSRCTSFHQKYDVLIINCQIKVYRGFLPVYGTLNENQLLRAQKKTKRGYRYTVYCHGIPLSGKKDDADFYFDLVVNDVRFF